MNRDLLSPHLFGICAATQWAQEYAERCRRDAELMADAVFITRKTEDEIRAAAARSPLSFADFVQQLKAGLRI